VTKLRRILLLGAVLLIALIVFVFDVIALTGTVGGTLWQVIRDLALLGAVLLMLMHALSGRAASLEKTPRRLGRLLTIALAVMVAAVALGYMPTSRFNVVEGASGAPVPANFATVFVAMVVTFGLVFVAIETLLLVQQLVFHKRKKGTKRNFTAYVILLLASSCLSLPLLDVVPGFLGMTVFVLAIVLIAVISFRQGWVVYLSRREKIYSILYSLFLMITFVGLAGLVNTGTFVGRSIDAESAPLGRFVNLNFLLGASYFGMAFISTLFHLPTAEVYERKQSELSSLHNLSRLVNQVFDFSELVSTVTQMTREVSGARATWLELLKQRPGSEEMVFEVAALDNITAGQIEAINAGEEYSLRSIVQESQRVLLVEEAGTDKRTRHFKKAGLKIGSLLLVPLVSQGRIIGILNATSDVEYAFDQDDIDVLTTFADHVTIAIENSRLIAQSLVRERFQQEMMVAQRMQKRLLPQYVPVHPALEVAAVSEPSLEVGGDYYDFVGLEGNSLGIVVADVSGKGVSAAFYMAEMKGIFQSLASLGLSPRQFIVRANKSLVGSLEKKAFISLLYGRLDLGTGELLLARAGHCPMVYISGDRREFIRPVGLGLGLTDGEIFEESIGEQKLRLQVGDICMFYTDGITEARNAEGEEFGYDRLATAAGETRSASAQEILEKVMKEIRTFTGQSDLWDDLTLVVVKWKGHSAVRETLRPHFADERA
jgi:phosphoserine phosphatase RsbU/P